MDELKPGWLERQIKATQEEMKSWPKWMLIQAGVDYKRGQDEENSRRMDEQ